ncbi:MAG: SWIM zinc finger family protein [Burkholderiales bacterium]|nr:SWIM zinc finger family protein [Burkholderiales bacterium]
MSRWSRWSPFPTPAPKRPPPERGIKVKRVGATWWGRRWIEALERLSSNYSNRLARGRTYARAGRVHDLVVAPGKVTARVTGSRATPYKVTLRIAPLAPAAWDKAIGEMARQALFAAELLAGQMPTEIDGVFHAAGRSLFPATEKDLETDCSCPDWANPCKHVAATHYVLGEAFDKDPFLLFELRGRSKEDVLGALRKRRAGAAGAADGAERAAPGAAQIPFVSLAKRDPAEYERHRGPPLNLHFRIEPPASSATLLRQLGAPPSWSLDEPPAEVLAPLYQAAGALARDLALRPAEESAPVSTPPRPKPRARRS